MDEIEQYFTENEAALTAAGVTKESGNVVDVRHVLITPEGGQTEGNTTVYSDEEWEACRQKAEELLNKRNDFNVKDLTAYNAVLQIKTNGKATIIL
jgi:hypothetical protein